MGEERQPMQSKMAGGPGENPDKQIKKEEPAK